MAAVTAEMVKNLREQTGAGMMDCKRALGETDGDLNAAVDWLRKKGLAAAAKKAGRVAAEGKVVCLAQGNRGVVVEVNTETDFTAKNESFVAFTETVAQQALAQMANDAEALKAAAYPGSGRNVGEELNQLISTIGENMSLRRCANLSVGQGVVASYIHMGGKIGVLVGLESAAAADQLVDLGKKVAMQVAAANPAYLDRGAVDMEALERERAVLAEQAKASGKTGDIVDKMVQGRINKFYGEVCLLEQPFIMDDKLTVTQAVAAAAKEIGAPVKVTGFVRYALGEGLAKKEENFAEEVAKQLG